MLKRVGFQDCHHDRNNVYPLRYACDAKGNEDPRCAPMVRDPLPCGDAEHLPAAEPGTFSPQRPERPARATGLGDSEILR